MAVLKKIVEHFPSLKMLELRVGVGWGNDLESLEFYHCSIALA